jgi:WD40 repeat protein
VRYLAYLGTMALAANGLGADTPIASAPKVHTVAYSADGKHLLAASGEMGKTGYATVWQLPSGKRVWRHAEPKGIAAAMSPDGRRVAIGTSADGVPIIEIATGKIERELPGHGRGVPNLVYSNGGQRLATASEDGFVHVWNAADWSNYKTLPIPKRIYRSTPLALTSDGAMLACPGPDGVARLIDLASGQERHIFKNDGYFSAGLHVSSVPWDQIHFTADDLHVVMKSWQGTVAIRERVTGKWVSWLERGSWNAQVAVSRDSKLLAMGVVKVGVVAVNLAPADAATTSEIRQLSKGWDNESFAVRDQASKDIVALGIPALPELRAIEKESLSPGTRIRARLARDAIRSPAPIFQMRHPEGNIESLAFSPDGRTLSTGGADGVVRLWSLRTGRETMLLRQDSQPAAVPPAAVPLSEF